MGQIGLAQTACLQNQDMHIVVLGSSTAAGAGSSGGKSWVNLFRNYMQQINPANQVTNLANGGYNTYKLMPTTFIPPATRPLPDSNKNITRALSLQPDAIIVNLPSNDRAFPMQEQLNNFDSMYRVSLSAGVPMWIFTTQPIVSPTWAAFQRAVADSILNQYGTFAINVFAPLVDSSTFEIDSIYAADGVHVNNLGHAKILEAVINKNLPAQLLDVSGFPPVDLAISRIEEIAGTACGDSQTVFHVYYWNKGQNTTSGFIDIEVDPLNAGIPTQAFNFPTSTLAPCYDDTLVFTAATNQALNYEVRAIGSFTLDTVNLNDSLFKSFTYVGFPSISANDDSICIGQNIQLQAMSDPGDTIFWYRTLNDTIPLGGGNNLAIGPINTDTSFFVEAVRGNTRFEGDLDMADTFNVNWNGNMFNLLPQNDLYLDAIRIHPQEAIPQKVDVFYALQPYQNIDTFPAAWTFMFSDSITTFDNKGYAVLEVPDFFLEANDTIAITIRMHDSGRRLGYRNLGSEATYTDGNLTIQGGRGVSYGFSASFNPRIFNGSILYYFGSRFGGDCASARQEVLVDVIPKPTADFAYNDLGNGTISFTNSSTNYSSTLWNFGNGFLSTISNPTFNYQNSGSFMVTCIVTNACGTDTITKNVMVMPSRTSQLEQQGILVVPNPTWNTFQLKNIPAGQLFGNPQLFNALGQEVPIDVVKTINDLQVNILDPKAGIYHLKTAWGSTMIVLASE